MNVGRPPGETPLQFVDTEIRAVSGALRDQMWDVAELNEADADPQAVLQLRPMAHLIHIACHGEASAGAEALVLGGGARLTALEFITRHPVRCVTYLNACSLAPGRYLGGGVSRGIAYAFARAGAPVVLANLLPVEEKSTAQLAEVFYLAANHLPVGDALRHARQLLHSMVGPALWSSTVLLGDPRVWLDGRTEERRVLRSSHRFAVVSPCAMSGDSVQGRAPSGTHSSTRWRMFGTPPPISMVTCAHSESSSRRTNRFL